MKRQQVLSWFFVTAILFAALGGCRSNPLSDLPDELNARVRTFEDVVRWGALHKMYAFQKPDPERQAEVQQGLDNVRVTGYEIVEPINPIVPAESTGSTEPIRWRQAAQIDYVLTDRQVVRQLIDYQVWESEDEGKTWYRITPVPVFK